MPSLYKRKNSPYWVIAYTDATGRRLKKSSKCTVYEEAKAIAQEWEEAIRVAKKKRLLAKQHQTVVREIHGEPKSTQGALPINQITPHNVPNQREIARRMGISQATVSKALRGDRSISPKMRREVQESATQLGYHSNAYVNVLMSRIRSGKKLSDRGVIAMLVDGPSQQLWHMIESYRVFHEGVIRRGRELGFHVESFFLRSPNLDATKMDRILQARGIQGVILAPPYRGNRSLRLIWENYAAVGVGFGWEEQELDRVVFDSQNNFVIAFKALQRLGYRRIGTVLAEQFTKGMFRGIKWYTGFLESQCWLQHGHSIPVCSIPTLIGDDGNLDRKMFSPAYQARLTRLFEKWFKKWRPDALLTIAGYEEEWVKSMGKRVPEDIGIACLAQPVKPDFARIDERAEDVGATALEWVASKIARNEYGLPRCPKVSMIEGEWVNGCTVKEQN